MTETNKKPIVGRGIASARGTIRLKFTHETAKPNGLFLAHLDSCEVKNITIGEDKVGMPSFNGLEIPKLTFVFASNEVEPAKRQYVSLSFNAVESNVNTIPGGKEEWKVNMVFDWIKHILDVYVLKGRELTDEEAQMLNLPFVDFDENGEYVAVDVETVIAGWKTLFENVENILNRGKEGAPYYKSKDGKDISVWIKLLRYIKTNKKGWEPINNGDLSFPQFVGEGCIEVYKPNTPTSIRVNVIKEAIRPMNIEKSKPASAAPSTLGYTGTSIPTGPSINEPMSPMDFGGLGLDDDLPM